MSYAEIAINSPIAQRKTFSYAIPPDIDLKIGHAVWVPFGSLVLQGIVFSLADYSPIEKTRDIIGVIDPTPVLSPLQIELAHWISDYYLAPLFDAAALMLPPGFERKPVTFITLSPKHHNLDAPPLTTIQTQIILRLEKEEKVSPRTLENSFGKKEAKAAISQLLHRGLVTKVEEFERIKIKPKYESYLRLKIESESAIQELQRLNRAPKQTALLELLIKKQPLSLQEARINVFNPLAAIKALEDKGLISREYIRIRRDPLLSYTLSPSEPPKLTAAQDAALSQIKPALRQPVKKGVNVFLLHGVTGSGKTEVYLRALEEAVSLGKRGIVLVPEIALTPQTIRRFAIRFPGRVALLHSKLSQGEQYDEWQEIKKGAFDVVIGPRGALFSPQPDLGLIVIDEEHEWAYKQQDQSPRYHAREAAIKLSELTGAVVIMGSATPDIESFYRTQKGSYQLLELPQRIKRGFETPLPKVEVVDMRRELKSGNRSIFSNSLIRAIGSTLAAKEQVILFLNRRGTSTLVQCRSCGYVIKCPRCELPLTYHNAQDMLECHQCNYRKANPEICPECQSRKIKFLGTGTQKVEEEIGRTFPRARVLRWDRDVTQGKNAHEHILNKFLSHQADILIGTQMIAKGLDVPSVTLVGIISADTILHFPDFRAAERTYQLLNQVAGRAGRGTSPGQVVVQTYAPEHYAIGTSAWHDYTVFYNKEIIYRQQYKNPPFNRLARLVYHHTNTGLCQRESERIYHILKEEIDSRDIPETVLIGPSPTFFPKVRGRFRWQIILRGPDPAHLLADLPLSHGWTVDIDPINLL